MTKWNELLPTFNQKFNSLAETLSTAKRVTRTPDIANHENFVSFEDRTRADVLEPKDIKCGSMGDGIANPKKRKRLIDVITEATVRAAS